MTRKDFELIAEALKDSKPHAMPGHTEAMDAWRDVVDTMATALKGANPRFDADRFKVACGSLQPA